MENQIDNRDVALTHSLPSGCVIHCRLCPILARKGSTAAAVDALVAATAVVVVGVAARVEHAHHWQTNFGGETVLPLSAGSSGLAETKASLSASRLVHRISMRRAIIVAT